MDLYPFCPGELCNRKYLLHCNSSILPRPLDWEDRKTISWKVAGWLLLPGMEYFVDRWLGKGIVRRPSVWKACGFFQPYVAQLAGVGWCVKPSRSHSAAHWMDQGDPGLSCGKERSSRDTPSFTHMKECTSWVRPSRKLVPLLALNEAFPTFWEVGLAASIVCF